MSRAPLMQAEQTIEDAIRQAFFYAYPNPQRIDCPSRDVLKTIAERRESKNGDLTAHMSRCSPCTLEFLELRRTWQRRQTQQRLALTATGVIAAMLLLWMFLPVDARRRLPTAENRHDISLTIARLDYHDPRLRGQGAAPPQIVSAQSNELRIILPKGTETGNYSVSIQRPVRMGHDLALFSGEATAGVDRLVTIRARVDLSRFAPGEYLAEWRHDGNENYGSFFIAR